MARDVELNVTAADRTGTALASMERNFKRTQDKIKRDQERAAGDFQKVAGNVATSGSKIGALFGENVAKGLSRAAPALAPVLAGVGIAAAPVIGGTIAAAVIGGAGIGGVIGGVALAARDARVQAAGTQLGNNLLNSLQARASVFVEPVLQGIKDIQSGFDDVGADISRIFANSAKFVQPLTRGVTVALQRITQAIAKLTDGAGPVIEAISVGIAGLGDAVGDVFEDLAESGVSAAVALRQVFQVLEVTIRGVGAAVKVLVESYGFLAKIGAFGRDAQQEMFRLEANAKLAAEGNRQVDGSLQGVQSAGAGAATAIRGLVGAVGDLNAENRTLYGTQVNAAEAIARTTEIIKDNGKGLDLNTKRGRENRGALSDLAGALNSNYEAYVAVNGAGAGADAVMASNRASFIALAAKAGYGATEVLELANQLFGVPSVSPKVTVRGVDEAKGAARTISNTLNAIQDENVYVNVIYKNGQNSSALRAAVRKNESAAGDRWAQTDLNSAGLSRTGGPVSVNSTVENVITLDGAPFRAFTARAVSESEKRQDWKRRVGGRF